MYRDSHGRPYAKLVENFNGLDIYVSGAISRTVREEARGEMSHMDINRILGGVNTIDLDAALASNNDGNT